MKTYRIFTMIFVLLTMQTTFAQTPTLIAHYPLQANANDSTGNNAPMNLINTPFQEGGIYCNGNYLFGDSDSCHAQTPLINNFNFESFSVRAKFKANAPKSKKPVFVCGRDYRWIAFYLQQNGTVAMKYNNSNYLTSDVAYSLDTWHEATITYSDSVGRLYLDDSLVISVKFDLVHGNDKTIGITDFSDGLVFKGIFSDLKIYTGDIYTRVTEAPWMSAANSFSLAQNYPNPFNSQTMIHFDVAKSCHVMLRVYNIQGAVVATLFNEQMKAGHYQKIVEANSLVV